MKFNCLFHTHYLIGKMGNSFIPPDKMESLNNGHVILYAYGVNYLRADSLNLNFLLASL